MKSNQIIKILLKRKKVSYGQIGRAKGVDRQVIFGMTLANSNNTKDFLEIIEWLGYTCVVVPKEDFDQHRDLFPKALELSNSSIDKEITLICPNCGREISDEDISEGVCSKCNGKIVINLYPPEENKTIDFTKEYCVKKGRPFKIKEPTEEDLLPKVPKGRRPKGSTKVLERRVKAKVEQVTFDYSKTEEERKENKAEDDIRLFESIYDDPS